MKLLGAGPTALVDAASVGYVQSRLLNLVTNGSGLLGTNANFSTFTFDATNVAVGGGSFKCTAFSATLYTDELIPVDPARTYLMSLWAASTTHAVGAHAYFGMAPYDIDGNLINPQFYLKYAGSTDTTLAAPLNPGDTTVTLTSAAGWHPGGSYPANFAWYGYTNAKGYTYPDYTYTRLTSTAYSDFFANGAWAAGGITGNVITLRAPWAGPALPSGTKIRNLTSGGTYKYVGAGNVDIPAAWTQYSGSVGGLDTTGSGTSGLFPYGTAYVKLVFLMNRDVAGNVTNLSGVSLTDLTTANLEPASATVSGVVRLTADLGGTATAPTTPTAVHLAGTETITGAKTFSTGPTVPTSPGAGTDAASKSYVDGTVRTVTTTTTANNRDIILADAISGGFTVTVPITVGVSVTVKKIDSSVNVVTVVGASGTIDGDANATLVGQDASAVFVGDGTNVQVQAINGMYATAIADVKSAEVDFGTLATRNDVVTISDVTVNTASQVTVQQSGAAATGRQADENELEFYVCNARAQNGSFVVNFMALDGCRLQGKSMINYVVG